MYRSRFRRSSLTRAKFVGSFYLRVAESGFSLLEVLASVFIMGLFVGSLVALTTVGLIGAAVDAQKLVATIIGNGVIAQMAVYGSQNVPATQTVTENGVTYSISIQTHVNNPALVQNTTLNDVRVTVTWHNTYHVTVEQVLAQ